MVNTNFTDNIYKIFFVRNYFITYLEIWDKITSYFKLTKGNNYFYKNRIKQNKYWLKEIINQSIINNFYQNEKVRREYKNQVKKIEENNVDVFEAYQKIILSQES